MNQRGKWITDAVLNLRFHRSAEAELRPPAFSHLPSPATLHSIDVYRWYLPLPGGVSPDVSIAEIAISARLDSRGGGGGGGRRDKQGVPADTDAFKTVMSHPIGPPGLRQRKGGVPPYLCFVPRRSRTPSSRLRSIPLPPLPPPTTSQAL